MKKIIKEWQINTFGMGRQKIGRRGYSALEVDMQINSVNMESKDKVMKLRIELWGLLRAEERS